MDMEAYLNQGGKWINRDGGLMEIPDMVPLWRKNAARWLIRNAGALWQAYELSRFRNQIIAFDASESEPDVPEVFGETTEDLVAMLAAISKPDEWIQTTALYRALTARDRHAGIEALIPGGPDKVYRRAAV